jgi:hypothetical protein
MGNFMLERRIQPKITVDEKLNSDEHIRITNDNLIILAELAELSRNSKVSIDHREQFFNRVKRQII